MNKDEILTLLRQKGIPFEYAGHRAVYNMEEMREVHLPHPEAEAKNLFVRDDKKRNYYLITVRGEKRIDLKKFQSDQGTRRLSFASDDDLMSILGLTPGAVSPFGLLNDREHRTVFYIDREFTDADALIGVHPNENTATVWLKTSDLNHLLSEHGTTVRSFEI